MANWLDKYQEGGSLPGATGMMYARTINPAPSNGPYAKKTKASAKNGSVIKDDRGQWDHPGEITEINSNNITMQGVNYSVLGVSDTGDTKMMQPGKNYKFKGKKVTEYPMAQSGIIVNNPNDTRLKKYQDSLNLYNKGEKNYKEKLTFNKKNNIPISSIRKWNDPVSFDNRLYTGNKNDIELSKIQPIEGNGYYYNHNPDVVANTNISSHLIDPRGFRYKKPSQPVEYQKSEPAPVVEAPKVEVKKVKGSKKYFINETEVDEPTFNKIVPKKEGMQNGGWLDKWK